MLPTIQPGSDEHQDLRHRRITGSKIDIVMNGTYVGLNSLSKLMHGEPVFYGVGKNTPSQLKRGIEWEPRARNDLWNSNPELTVTQPGFLTPEDFGVDLGMITEWLGYSPDGVLQDLRDIMELLEIKTQNEEVWAKYSARGIVNPHNMPQMQLGLLITGWDSCWYRAFNPNPEGDQKYFDVKVLADRAYHKTMIAKCEEFVAIHAANEEFKPPISSNADLSALQGL